MNHLIVYRSKYGSTARYARWLAEALHADLVEAGRIRQADLEGYDKIVYGGGVYAGGVLGLGKIKKILQQCGKPVFLFAVGATAPCEEMMETLCCRLKPEQIPARLYYLRGAFDIAAMRPADRLLIRMLQKGLARKPPETWEPWARDMMDNRDRAADWTDRQALVPLLEAIKRGE